MTLCVLLQVMALMVRTDFNFRPPPTNTMHSKNKRALLCVCVYTHLLSALDWAQGTLAGVDPAWPLLKGLGWH